MLLGLFKHVDTACCLLPKIQLQIPECAVNDSGVSKDGGIM
jgi:hypothetical protein